ncbi:MAG: hypothetical protein LBL08_01965 [Candidatus Nomurabacteria bacterium]|jgi:hypothetical protein|nr:hypothetical protein [Candidatus Nomurabacteria bacterium]
MNPEEETPTNFEPTQPVEAPPEGFENPPEVQVEPQPVEPEPQPAEIAQPAEAVFQPEVAPMPQPVLPIAPPDPRFLPPNPPPSEPPPEPPQRHEHHHLIIIGAALFGVLALIAIVVAVFLQTPQTSDDQPQADLAAACDYTELWPAEVDGVKRYCMAERPAWNDFLVVYKEACDALCPDKMPAENGGQYMQNTFNLDVTNNADDRQYALAMSMILTRDYEAGKIQFSRVPMYQNAAELDAIIAESTKQLQETWNRFRAHQDLGYEIDTTIGGEQFTFDGKYHSDSAGVDQYEPITESLKDSAGREIKIPVQPQVKKISDTSKVDLEAWSTQFELSAPDSDGTYSSSINRYVKKFDMTLDYDFSHIYKGCPAGFDGDVKLVVAAYCHGTPTKIFINDDYKYYPDSLKSPNIIDVIKHEMGHHLISEICGTVEPIIAGTQNEAVTSSYAVLFLGADLDFLNNYVDAKYKMTTKSNKIARQIHDDKRCY